MAYQDFFTIYHLLNAYVFMKFENSCIVFFLEYCKENKIANFPSVRYYYKGHHIEDVSIGDESTPELFLSFLNGKLPKDEL